MTAKDTHPSFDFSRFLSPSEQAVLSNAACWEWITPFNRPEPLEPLGAHNPGACVAESARISPALAMRHRRWMKKKGNCHRPAHREIMLMLRGEAIYSLEGALHWRRPGTLIMMERHAQRDLKGSPDKVGFTCLWLHLFSRHFMTYFINACDDKGRFLHLLPVQSRTGEDARMIMETWDQCASDPEDAMCRMLLRSLVASKLLEILGNTAPLPAGNHQEQLIASIKEYIHLHLADDLSLQALANIAGYSPFFFHRLFVRHVGQTPVQYINAARLAKACELLDQNYTVQAASMAVGFSSVSYFHQFFKRHFRRTPRVWSERFHKKWAL